MLLKRKATNQSRKIFSGKTLRQIATDQMLVIAFEKFQK